MSNITLLERSLIKLVSISLIVFCFNLFIPRNDLLHLYDSKRVFVVLLVMAFAVILMLSASVRLRSTALIINLSRSVKLILSAMLIFSGLATLLSDYHLSAWSGWLYLLGLIATVVMFYAYYRQRKQHFFSLAALLNLLLFSSVAFAFWIRLYNHVPVGQMIFIGFANQRFINQLHVWLIFPLAYLALRATYRQATRHDYYRYIFYVAMAFSVCFTLQGRGILLSLMVGVLLIMLVDKEKRWAWGKLFLSASLLGLLITLTLFTPFPSWWLDIPPFGDETEVLNVTSSGRSVLWLKAFEMTTFWGNGAGAYACQELFAARPHSSVLNILVHWGVIPAVSYVLLCLLLLKHTVYVSSRLSKVLGVNLLTGLCYSLVSGVLDSPLSQLLAVMSLGAYWASLPRPVACPVSARQFSRHGFLHTALIVLALGIVLACAYRLHERLVHYPQPAGERISVQEDGLRTQFWLGYNCLEQPWQP